VIYITEQNFDNYFGKLPERIRANLIIVDEFLKNYNNDNVSIDDLRSLNEVMGVKELMNFDRIHELNIKLGAYDDIIHEEYAEKANCDELLDIRNAMLNECAAYIEPIESYCAGAVMIAYWWKSRDCD